MKINKTREKLTDELQSDLGFFFIGQKKLKYTGKKLIFIYARKVKYFFFLK